MVVFELFYLKKEILKQVLVLKINFCTLKFLVKYNNNLHKV